MKKVFLFTTMALFVTTATFAGNTHKKKCCHKESKACCHKGAEACCHKDAKAKK